MRISEHEKLQRWRGRIVCWATHPDVRNYDGRARSRVLHLVRIGSKFVYPATICGMAVVKYVTVPKSYNCATYNGRQLCSPCQKQLNTDKIIYLNGEDHKWGGKTAEEWSRERDTLALRCKDLDLQCRDLAIKLGGEKAYGDLWRKRTEKLEELHKVKPPGFLDRLFRIKP